LTIDINFVVITRQSNPSISKFSRPYNEFKSIWSMFSCNMLCYHFRINFLTSGDVSNQIQHVQDYVY